MKARRTVAAKKADLRNELAGGHLSIRDLLHPFNLTKQEEEQVSKMRSELAKFVLAKSDAIFKQKKRGRQRAMDLPMFAMAAELNQYEVAKLYWGVV